MSYNIVSNFRYRCSSCSSTYDSRDEYKDHMRRAHRQPFVDKTSKENAVDQQETEQYVLKSTEKAEPIEYIYFYFCSYFCFLKKRGNEVEKRFLPYFISQSLRGIILFMFTEQSLVILSFPMIAVCKCYFVSPSWW